MHTSLGWGTFIRPDIGAHTAGLKRSARLPALPRVGHDPGCPKARGGVHCRGLAQLGSETAGRVGEARAFARYTRRPARTIFGTVASVIDERDARWRGDGVRNLSAPAR